MCITIQLYTQEANDLDKDKNIEEYYSELFSTIKYTEILRDSQYRFDVYKNIDLTDPNIKAIFSKLTSLSYLQTVFLPGNREKLVELIKVSDLPKEQKDFLLDFKDDYSLFLPMGGGGPQPPDDKDNSKEMKNKIVEAMEALTTAGLIISLMLQAESNHIEREKLELSKEEFSINSELKEEELELEREELDILKRQLEEYDFDDDFNQIY